MANGTKKRAAAAGGGNPDMKVRNPIHRQDQAQQRTRVENPLFSAAEPDTDADADTLDWTDDMLQDLAFAFEACDVDHDGHIDAEELLVIMRVLGDASSVLELDLATVRQLIEAERQAWEELRTAAVPSRGVVLLQRQKKLLEKAALHKGVQAAKYVGAPLKDATKRSLAIAKSVPIRRMDSNDSNLSSVDSASGDCGRLDYPMFAHLLTSGRVNQYIGGDHDDWEDHVYRMRLLKHAWDTADLDANGSLTQTEMRKTARSLFGHITEAEVSQFWALLQPSTGGAEVAYLDFLNGMAGAASHEAFREKFARLTPNQLITVLVDIPIMAKEEKMMMASLSWVERLGVRILTDNAGKWTKDRHDASVDKFCACGCGAPCRGRHALHHQGGPSVDAVMARITSGSVHLLTPTQRQNLMSQHAEALFFASVFGFVSSSLTALAENVATIIIGTNGIVDPDTGQASSESEILAFGGIVLITLMLCSAVEIAMLYRYALNYAMTVAIAAGLKLTPLNRVRTAIAQFLVRAALELAHPAQALHGVDPKRETGQGSKCMACAFIVVYKAKTALTSFILKVAMKRFTSRDIAKYAVPYMAVPATMLWNVLIMHSVMKQAKLRSIGIPASIELCKMQLSPTLTHAHARQACQNRVHVMFIDDEIMISVKTDLRDHRANTELSALFKLQLLRAIGSVIVRRGRLYPTQEVLLKHAVHSLHMANNVDHTQGVVDSIGDFITDLPSLSSVEQGAVLQVFVLTIILDGHMSKKEAELYGEVCEVCGQNFSPHENYIRFCAQQLRNAQPLDYVDLRHCVYWEPDDGAHALTLRYYLAESIHSLFTVCTC